jgi:hypothetical protein
MSSRKSLVDIWLLAEAPEQAFARLNAAINRKHDYRRAWEWRTGRRQIPSPARRFIVAAALPYALKCVGVRIAPAFLQDLAEMLA